MGLSIGGTSGTGSLGIGGTTGTGGLGIGGTAGTGIGGGSTNGGGGHGTFPLPDPVVPPLVPGPTELAPVSVAERTEAALATGSAIGVIYGRNLVAPDIFFGAAYSSSSTWYLARWGLAFGEGEINAFEAWCVNGTPIPAGYLSSYFDLKVERSGSLAQTAVSGGYGGNGFGEQHGALPGLAYAYVEMAKNCAVIPQAIVQGAKLYDPRLGPWSSGDEAPSAYKAYSANPALESADLLTNARYGLGVSASQVDWTSVASAATYCDTLVNGRKRFECHLVLRSRDTADSWLSTINAHFGGSWVQAGGLWTLFVHSPIETAAVPLTEDDLIDSPVLGRSTGAGLADIPNRVTVEWVDPAAGWTTRTTPIVSPEVEAGAPVREGSCYRLHGCQDEAQAFRIGWYLLNAMSADLTIRAKLLPRNLHLAVGSLVSVTAASVGLSGQQFVVTDVTFEGDQVAIRGVEYDASIWSPAAYTPTALPDPTKAPPADVTGAAFLTEDLRTTTTTATTTEYSLKKLLGVAYFLPPGCTGVRLRVRAVVDSPGTGSVNPQAYSWSSPEMAASEAIVPLNGNRPVQDGGYYWLVMETLVAGVQSGSTNITYGGGSWGWMDYAYRVIVVVEDADGRLSPGVTLDRVSSVGSAVANTIYPATSSGLSLGRAYFWSR